MGFIIPVYTHNCWTAGYLQSTNTQCIFLFDCLTGRGLVENVWIFEQTYRGMFGGAKKPQDQTSDQRWPLQHRIREHQVQHTLCIPG